MRTIGGYYFKGEVMSPAMCPVSANAKLTNGWHLYDFWLSIRGKDWYDTIRDVSTYNWIVDDYGSSYDANKQGHLKWSEYTRGPSNTRLSR